MRNKLLSKAYWHFDRKKYARLRACASSLSFQEREDGSKKLVAGHFCCVRLCPMCAWRRTLKIFFQFKKVMAGMNSENAYAYLFLTFTVKNCPGHALSDQLDAMLHGWDIMMRRKNMKSAIKGWYRGLEITHNTDPISPSFDSFHPHFHCIFAVNKSYFTDRSYISQADWTSLWQSAMNLDYSPIVDVRKVKGNTAKAVSEVAKYSVKDADYIIPDDWDLTVNTVQILDAALHNRRLVAYGGKMKDWHKKLNLDDAVDGDLIHIDDDDPSPDDQLYPLVSYVWRTGYAGPDYYKDS